MVFALFARGLSGIPHGKTSPQTLSQPRVRQIYRNFLHFLCGAAKKELAEIHKLLQDAH
jgi:hypothetical protein